jgi:hypothetical protein
MSTNIPAVQNTPTIRDAEFVSLQVTFTNGVTQTNRTFYFSTSYRQETIGGNVYTELGALIGVTASQRDIQASGFDTAVTLVGVDSYWIYVVAGAPATQPIPVPNQAPIPVGYYPLIKGSIVTIRRGFYNTNYILTSTVLRYTGLVTSYAINEERDNGIEILNDTYTISLQCSAYRRVLENRISGRRTNPTAWKYWFAGDTSMDRVPGLESKQFDFGKPVITGNDSNPSNGGGGDNGQGFNQQPFYEQP